MEIGDICTIADVWDGEGAKPDESYAYKVTDSGYDGESDVDYSINYVWEILKEAEDFLETEIKIVDIELV